MKNRVLHTLTTVAKASPWLTLALILTVAGSIVSALIPPLILEHIIDTLTTGVGIGMAYALLYFAALAVSGVFDSIKEVLITKYGQKIARSVRHDMCAKVSHLPASYFTHTEAGATVSRFIGDVDTIESLFSSGIIGMFVDICKVIGILAVIVTASKGVGLLMLPATVILFVFTRFVQKRMLAAQLDNRSSVAHLNNFVPETIKNIRTIHVLGIESHMEDKYDKMLSDSYSAVERSNFCSSIYSPVVNIVSTAIIAIMMLFAATGGEMQSFFGMSVGTAVAIIAYIGKIFAPIENIGMEIQSVQAARAGIARVNEFLSETERTAETASIDAKCMPIELDDVTFGYDNDSAVLRALSFCVNAGESVTLTGRTGAGKSTIFKLLLGFYSPQCGHVKVFGADAELVPDSMKRKIFGYVEQSFRAVPGSVYDQITVFDASIRSGDVERAINLVGLTATIESLKDGYNTPYAPELFSQGQQQLLAIARAIVSDPAILLLDEITANLDADTEKTVLNALQRASNARTVISISHRLYETTGGRVINIE